MASMLEEILKIKIFRESKAQGEVKRTQYQLEQSLQAIEDRKREKVEYQQWRIQEEERLFQQLQERLVAVDEIDSYKLEVGVLRTRDNVYEDNILKAQHAAQQAQQAVEEAKSLHRQAVATREKFAEQVTEWRKEVQRLRDYQEDLELEEFSGAPSSGDDEDNDDSQDW